jgi:hypothetical protein
MALGIDDRLLLPLDRLRHLHSGADSHRCRELPEGHEVNL